MYRLVQNLVIVLNFSIIVARPVQNAHLARHVARFEDPRHHHLKSAEAIVDSTGTTGFVKKTYGVKGVARAESNGQAIDAVFQMPVTPSGVVATSPPSPAASPTTVAPVASTFSADIVTTSVAITTSPAPGTQANVAPSAGTTTPSPNVASIVKAEEEEEDDTSIDDGTLLGMFLGVATLLVGVGCVYGALRFQLNVANSSGGAGASNIPSSPHDNSQDPTTEIDRRLSFAERRRNRGGSTSPRPSDLTGLGLPGLEEPSTDSPQGPETTPRGRTGSAYAQRRSERG